MRREEGRAPMGAFAGLLVYLLIGLFAVMAMFCVIVGAEVYRGAVRSADENAGLRTTISYVTGKLRAADARSGVERIDGPEGDCLKLTEDIGGTEYVTYIYGYQGQIREIFTLAEAAFDPEGGQAVASAESFAISEVRPGLMRLEVCVNGETYASHVALRSLWEG